MVENITNWYKWGFWTKDMVLEAVPSLLTQEQAEEIIKIK